MTNPAFLVALGFMFIFICCALVANNWFSRIIAIFGILLFAFFNYTSFNL